MSKYAVVIGVNYVQNPEAALQGCCNDARLVLDMLRSKGFEDDNIKVLIDDDDQYEAPNHINVKKALKWLCSDRDSEDIIFMHFSGHGTQVPSDGDDEETDDLDEAIVLEGIYLMADDDIKQFFGELPEGTKTTVVMDCCHSGSMLDGTEVIIEGPKDEDSAEGHGESDALLAVLGGSRGYDGEEDGESEAENRSLPIGTICNMLSSKLGADVPPTGNGVNGAMAQMFGGDAGRFMVKFALSKLAKNDGGGGGGGGDFMSLISAFSGSSGGNSSSGSGNALSSIIGGKGGKMLSSFLGGGGSSGGGGGDPLSALLGGGGGSGATGGGGGGLMSSLFNDGPSGGGGDSNPMSSLLGAFGGQPTAPPPRPEPTGQNPMSMLTGMLGNVGLDSSADKHDAPQYNPNHRAIPQDTVTLITGCQAHETSADVRPPGGGAYGALTKNLTDIQKAKPDISNYDLVRTVRAALSQKGFKQNPCLETTESLSTTVFICE